MTTNRWGCPDWQVAEKYPTDESGLNDNEWRWQYLRRLPEYRKLWVDAETEISVSSRVAIEWIRSMLEEQEFPKGKLELVLKRIEKRVVEDCEFRFLSPNLENLGIRETLLMKFGLRWLIDPCTEKTGFSNNKLGGRVVNGNRGLLPDFEKLQQCIRKLPEAKSIEEIEYEVASQWPLVTFLNSENLSLVAFDLTRPLSAQLDDAKKSLLQQQKSISQIVGQMKSSRRKNWPRHLRVIDAKDQGATHTEIYGHFATEQCGTDEDALDEFYRPGTQPKAIVSQWYAEAQGVMAKAVRFL